MTRLPEHDSVASEFGIRIEDTLYPPYIADSTKRSARPYLRPPLGLTYRSAIVLHRESQAIYWLLRDHNLAERSMVYATPNGEPHETAAAAVIRTLGAPHFSRRLPPPTCRREHAAVIAALSIRMRAPQADEDSPRGPVIAERRPDPAVGTSDPRVVAYRARRQ